MIATTFNFIINAFLSVPAVGKKLTAGLHKELRHDEESQFIFCASVLAVTAILGFIMQIVGFFKCIEIIFCISWLVLLAVGIYNIAKIIAIPVPDKDATEDDIEKPPFMWCEVLSASMFVFSLLFVVSSAGYVTLAVLF